MQKTSDAAPTLSELNALALDAMSWQKAAQIAGEHFAPNGPDGYYDMTAQQWLEWAIDRAGRLREVPEGEYICTCGIRVSPHRCPTGSDF